MVTPRFSHLEEEFAGNEEHDFSHGAEEGDIEACGICMDRPATEELRLQCLHKNKYRVCERSSH